MAFTESLIVQSRDFDPLFKRGLALCRRILVLVLAQRMQGTLANENPCFPITEDLQAPKVIPRPLKAPKGS